MPDPTMIAVIPTPDWREALLGDGEPQIAIDTFDWHYAPSVPPRLTHKGRPCLALMIDGMPVPDGIARAVRALARVHYGAECYEWMAARTGMVTLSNIQSMAAAMMAEGIGADGIVTEIVTDG